MRDNESPTGFEPSGRAASEPDVARRKAPLQRQNPIGADVNPAMRAAKPLLIFFGQLRAGLVRAPSAGLAPSIAASIEACERTMIAAKAPPGAARTATQALRATADEVLANLPDANPDLAAREEGARQFFEALDRIKADPRLDVRLLELFHACLALGFQSGAASLRYIRRDLYAELRKRTPPPPPELSPSLRGRPRHSPARGVRAPLWVWASLACLLLFGVFIGMRLTLVHRAEAAAKSLASLNPLMPVSIARKSPTAPPPMSDVDEQDARIDRIRKTLEPDLAAGAISVHAALGAIVLQIPEAALFEPGRTRIRASARSLLSFLGLALEPEQGVVKVIGHSDGKPISNPYFGADFDLALERAKNVAAVLKQSLSRPERIVANAAAPRAGEASGATRGVDIIILRSD
ncbi:DotU family type IV/VI secretion system protein [Methylocapsa acidiphila]|uniref:DotU family type IV/VI secretion system protein n=1 Tax=Methylocapsa acidiphila TaxID=133552 RepID=UPI000429DF00|nr:DotU family type IV/VI secretion system protein [Methylocapsa acidiphila]